MKNLDAVVGVDDAEATCASIVMRKWLLNTGRGG